jgi:hypothetical protein
LSLWCDDNLVNKPGCRLLPAAFLRRKVKMKEFDYYRLLLERLENQEPLDGLKEYEKMKDQTERIRKGMLMWMIRLRQLVNRTF